MNLSHDALIGHGKQDAMPGRQPLLAARSRLRFLGVLLVVGFCSLFPARSLAAWVEAHWEPVWVPEKTELQWQEGCWEDRWVDGYSEEYWVDGYWESQWTDGYWDSQWVDGYWDSQWVDGYWEDQWTDGYWEDQWVDGYWEEQWIDGYWDEWGNWVEGYWEWVWIDGYWNSVWVDGYWSSVWIDGYWSDVWIDGYWNDVWVDGYWSDVWVDGYSDTRWVDGYWESVWIDGAWVEVTIPGYWEPHGTWIEGYWDPPLVDQELVSSADASVVLGGSFEPTYSGGSGSGSYEWCVAGYTNWGTGSWTAGSTGNYEFWVRRLGDGTYTNSSPAGPYYLTVSPDGYSLTVAGGSGSGNYLTGEAVSITANLPADGEVFESWSQSGDGSLSNANWHQTEFTMGSSAVTVSANYRPVNFLWGNTPSSVPVGETYNVNVGVDSGGMPYVTLSKNGAYFSGGWFGTQGDTSDSDPGTANYDASFSDSLKPSSGSSSQSVSIYISSTYVLTTSANPSDAGSVSGGGSYANGAEVTVTATANNGYAFTGWSGSLSGTTNPTTAVMNGNKSVTANFTPVAPNTPVITSPSTASGTAGAAFNYQIAATNDPTSYNATNLPTGLNVNGATGVISGTPTSVGTTNVTITASNTSGAGTPVTLELTIYPEGGGGGPTITTQPASVTVNAGQAATFAVVAAGTEPLSYQWRKGGVPLTDGGNISGATSATLTITNAQTINAGTYDVLVINAGNSAASATATLTVSQLDPNGDADGDGVSNGLELELGLNPNDPSDVNVYTFTYDKINQLKRGPGGEYVKDAEGNIKEVQQ